MKMGGRGKEVDRKVSGVDRKWTEEVARTGSREDRKYGGKEMDKTGSGKGKSRKDKGVGRKQ